ncbi:hypothetical protein C6496_03070 [Candidatus Poribacteria bacterium]|nr:MAG: hypothetical protein C6496_03070 [Candidatus Poribacteria bacterium]
MNAKKLDWKEYQHLDDFRHDTNLTQFDCGVYIVWTYVQNRIKILYTGQGDIKNRFYCHNSQTDWGDHFPLHAAWANTFEMNGIERFLYDSLNPEISKASPRVTPIPVNLPSSLN